MIPKHFFSLIIHLVVLVLSITLTLVLFHKDYVYSGVFCIVLVVLQLYFVFTAINDTVSVYDKTISAILNNDYSADYTKHKDNQQYQMLFRLYTTLKTKRNEQASESLVYNTLLNTIETGVLILKKSGDDWIIFLMNDYFSNHFMVPKVSRWTYLKKQLPTLCSVVEERDFRDIKTSLQIRIDQQDVQTFVLQTSRTTTFGEEYYIVLLDSIQKVVEKKEKEAWINLMKVISHELMNSITPIRSLTQNLNELMQQESLSQEDLEDIRESVTTILHRSDHLQHFVDSYRQLAMLPSPHKENTDIQQLVATTLQLMQPLLKKEQITITNIVEKRWLPMDKLQIEQVLINLLTNSIYALKEAPERTISITSVAKNNRIFLTISDTGSGIEKEIQDKIFLPFFTTRKDGAGIGLTLSKNIIEAHGGYLNYQSESSGTHFVICFIE